MRFTSRTGNIFPLEMGKSFHDAEFIKRGRPQSAKLVHRTERNGKACDEFRSTSHSNGKRRSVSCSGLPQSGPNPLEEYTCAIHAGGGVLVEQKPPQLAVRRPATGRACEDGDWHKGSCYYEKASPPRVRGQGQQEIAIELEVSSMRKGTGVITEIAVSYHR